MDNARTIKRSFTKFITKISNIKYPRQVGINRCHKKGKRMVNDMRKMINDTRNQLCSGAELKGHNEEELEDHIYNI